ncbi:transaldolase [Corynebacterium lujinxingii]|uniref:Transaldolase n=1 Tax=Corynebacterium lujinxingii TaxID=2763010 RepID=A0A7H0JW95_9CORY|nr:transaldolase [Corynebacterium lujinxingii]MBC3178803.1 transaldolase [Corynebacterium lujinxingii]NNO11085.1 transaldolase [Corynebacterium lujinxingii]QNP89311.1 transaldolase [Corynebacterium lujinxingii]
MTAIDDLYNLGTSTWLDDLSRERIATGNLDEVKKAKSIVGVTTNPAIFASAMGSGTHYDEQLTELKEAGVTVDDAVYAMSVKDVQDACDLFRDTFEATGGKDGRVSIEVDPRYAADEAKTIAQAKELWELVGRDNLMIKIPATDESLPAVTAALAEGISVNVTLIFSVERYQQVIDAYKDGIRKAAANGHDVSTIHSVASFFVSRMDTEVDKRLETIGTDEALALRGKAGVANARLAYALFQKEFGAEVVDKLPEGANKQRPLWASTGVKNPDYPATMYVTELAGPDTVNTMPEKTIDAVLEHGGVDGDTLTGTEAASHEVFAKLREVGIDVDDVVATLEREGVDKFVDAWQELLDSMTARLA